MVTGSVSLELATNVLGAVLGLWQKYVIENDELRFQ